MEKSLSNNSAQEPQRKEHLTLDGLAKIRKLQENLRD